jgi:hypothetical protein
MRARQRSEPPCDRPVVATLLLLAVPMEGGLTPAGRVPPVAVESAAARMRGDETGKLDHIRTMHEKESSVFMIQDDSEQRRLGHSASFAQDAGGR